MDLFLFLSQLLNGLLDGFYYLLIAIGLSLVATACSWPINEKPLARQGAAA